SDGAVELDAVAAVDVDLAVVVHPRHAEVDVALRLHDPFEDAMLHVLGMLLEYRRQGVENLPYGLVEFLLVRIAFNDGFIYGLHKLLSGSLLGIDRLGHDKASPSDE